MLTLSGNYGVRMGKTCAVHKHTTLVPLNDHHVHPLGDGGPDIKSNKITVCANAHYSIHALLDYMIKHGPDVPWEYRRMFSPAVRKYAIQGYEAILAAGVP